MYNLTCIGILAICDEFRIHPLLDSKLIKSVVKTKLKQSSFSLFLSLHLTIIIIYSYIYCCNTPSLLLALLRRRCIYVEQAQISYTVKAVVVYLTRQTSNWSNLIAVSIYIQGVPKKMVNKDFLAKMCTLEP